MDDSAREASHPLLDRGRRGLDLAAKHLARRGIQRSRSATPARTEGQGRPQVEARNLRFGQREVNRLIEATTCG
jgi:hypothetical protein